MKILVTGATGNIGSALCKELREVSIVETKKASRKGDKLSSDEVFFDFEQQETFNAALKGIGSLFLLRPPQNADVDKYIKPVIEACKSQKVKHIVFLSVQGAEKIRFIPHAKIEKLIVASGIAYTFLRPSYFMQNLTTTFLQEVRQNNEIYIPSGIADFLWIDGDDIGKAAKEVLVNGPKHYNKSYTLTGTEYYNFGQVANMLSEQLGREIKHNSPSLLGFWMRKKREGLKGGFIMVMIMLHFLPRLQSKPDKTNDLKNLIGHKPTVLKEFLEREKKVFD